MPNPSPTVTTCSGEGCTEEFKNNKFAKVKAGAEGWFFQKDGRAFCPNHIPEWVETWRARQKGEV